MSNGPTPSLDPEKKYWWVAAVAVPILVALIDLIIRWHTPAASPGGISPPVEPSGPGLFVWLLPIFGFLLGAAIVAAIVFFLEDLPIPILFLFALSGSGFAIWAAVSITSEPPGPPIPVMIFVALSGISMLGFGIGCNARELRLGAYLGCCSAVAAALFLIIWEIGSSGGWVDDLNRITAAPGPFHIAYAVVVSLGAILSVPYILAWASLVLAVLSFAATLLMDFGGNDSSEMSPLGLGGFLAAMVAAHFALMSDAADDLPDWFESCLRYLRNLGGLGLIALSIVGCATNENNVPWGGAGIVFGLLFLIVGNATRRKRNWPY